MPRYDDTFRRSGPGYGGWDRDEAAREAYTPGGFGPRWQQRPSGDLYDADFRPHRGLGGDEAGAHDASGLGAPWTEAPAYGPSRYGLGPYYRRLRSRRRPDDEVKSEVEEALFYDTWVDAEAITVEVKDGVVTLRGELPDHDEIRYATDDAWDVEGVVGVRSELSINASKRKPLDGVDRNRDRAAGIREGNG